MILAPDGPRLIDFGIARGEGQTQITQTGAWNGTPGFVAPEVVREQQPLPASDVFSLAGTVAYAATGRPPFGGGRIEAIIHRTLSGEIDLEGVDPRVAGLVRQCAEKEPGARIALERLLRQAPAPGPLAADPAYRRIVGVPRPMPASVTDAVASGLVPADRTRTVPGVSRGRSRAAVIAAGAGVAAVVLVGALLARFALDGDGGDKNPNKPQAGQGTHGGTATGDPTGSTPGGRTPGAAQGADGAPPDRILVKQPGDIAELRWSKASSTCQPAARPEDFDLTRDTQTSAPREPYTKKTVEFGLRFKYSEPPKYYVAVQVRPPAEQQGNGVTGVVQSKPHLYPGNSAWLNIRYPSEFEWEGAGNGTYPLMKGDWTVIWLHVHPNGDAYYLTCDGFTVA